MEDGSVDHKTHCLLVEVLVSNSLFLKEQLLYFVAIYMYLLTMSMNSLAWFSENYTSSSPASLCYPSHPL